MLPALSGELAWNVLYDTNLVALVVTRPGDFNFDGAVDAGDYVVWQKGFRTTYTQDDYNVWRANFGAALGSGSSQFASPTLHFAIPGATSALLLLSFAPI